MTGYAPLPPSGQRPMTQTQNFFVFISADPQLRGLSWLRTGENLPCLMDSRTCSSASGRAYRCIIGPNAKSRG